MFSALIAPYIYIKTFVHPSAKDVMLSKQGIGPIGPNKILDMLQEQDKDK